MNQSRIENDYDLLNASNQKMGVLNYMLSSSGSEEFKVPDLNRNLTE